MALSLPRRLGAWALALALLLAGTSLVAPQRDHRTDAAREEEEGGELLRVSSALEARSIAPFTTLNPGAYAAAVTSQQALAASPRTVPGAAGAWHAVGTTPLDGGDPSYGNVAPEGFHDLAGRVQDFAVVPGTDRLFASASNGGVWQSDDLGGSWHSVGDRLPTQVVASVAWTPAHGGALLALTGDGSFGRSGVAGLGVFRTLDDGRSWQHATGVPDGSLGFRLAVDPADPNVVYAATSVGLFRSDDGGASFRDTLLPTGPCAGHATAPGCFFANDVTDVVVQAADKFGHTGGRVLAAVGWRAGDAPDLKGKPQSPRNGIYRSDDGKVGTFTRLLGGNDAPPGFTERKRIGRVALGVANGPGQNHDYVYALVQDAVKLNKGFPILDVPESVGKDPLPQSDVFNGVYVSPDFGSTWRLMSPAEALKLPTTGSALTGTEAISYGPGIQSWYNEWIQPDPTMQSPSGIPTRLTFGLEEVWQNQLPFVPQDGLSLFKAIGRYFGGTTCAGTNLNLPVCPTNLNDALPSTTTHPDQHGGVYVPDNRGGVTLIAGNDGGVYRQSVAAGQPLDNTNWGNGANRGFQTLQAYHAVMAKDGTIWSGLQDNGEMKVTPDGRQIEVQGGDAFFSAVDPDNSKVAYEEYTGGDVFVTKDGGHTWTDINPFVTNGAFSTPFAMDPHNPKHLLIGGQEIKETVDGPDTAQPTGIPFAQQPSGDNAWGTVFDLGAGHQVSAVALDGAKAYAGWCGACDPLSENKPFGRGIATNVGGKGKPAAKSPSGWHMAAAKGLPNRFITSIAMDPANPRTVYVTLAGYERRWAPPGAVEEQVRNVGVGHVYRSTDAGEHFANVSGNLPDDPANWVTIDKGHLLVGNDLGVLISSDLIGSHWDVLGTNLPAVPVHSIQVTPRNPDEILIATFGRGLYTYRFPPSPPHP